VYNGFDETRLPAAPRRDHNGFTVIMTGRMVPVKQYDVVTAAARLLSRNASGWRFVLVGEGTDRERLRRSASDLVATGIVVFAEPGLEVLDLVRDVDVGVLMTNPALAREGLSNSIMEYMALGLPVVCGDGGGNPELVLDGITGFIVPQGSPERLAERLIYLREHPDDARAMGAAGKTRIAEDFSVPTMVERMLAVYNEAIWRQRR
jgi:glycosyltransferase involved in cell wall biosynthesis